MEEILNECKEIVEEVCNKYGYDDHDKDGTTYKLTYIYMVDGKEYSVTTDYGTNYIPDKKIRRNS